MPGAGFGDAWENNQEPEPLGKKVRGREPKDLPGSSALHTHIYFLSYYYAADSIIPLLLFSSKRYYMFIHFH